MCVYVCYVNMSYHWATSLFGLVFCSVQLSQKVKSIFSFELSLNVGLSERLSESLSLKFGLSSKLI